MPERDITISVACNGFNENKEEGKHFHDLTESIIDTIMRPTG